MNRFGNSVCIAGTDTDIGKTVAAAAVLCALRGHGIDAVPMKPVQTGAASDGNRLVSPDLRFCTAMAGLNPDPREEALMAPYLFEPACSPHLAAAGCGREISFAHIVESLAALLERRQGVVVEGAGGLLAPLSEEKTQLDLIARLDLPVILVARPGLGTINHTLLSLHELDRAGLRVLGVVFCETQPTQWGEIEKENRRIIERMGETAILGRIPFLAGLTDGRVAPQEFRQSATEHLHLPLD
jgi:dethiobiotin synthetase